MATRDPDLAVANSNSGSVSILLGNGSGSFTGPTNFPAGSAPYSVAVGDFNRDSRPDLAVANVDSDNISILLGDGAGSFTGPTKFAFAGDGPWSVAVGDFNSDWRPDLAAAHYNLDYVSILLNTTPVPGYPRPRGAAPLGASLVPAYTACTAPNRVHGPPPLSTSPSDGSCNPPAQTSPNLTVGTPDAVANSIGSVRFQVIGGNLATPADEADVQMTASITDVRCQAGASPCGPTNAAGGDDYTGEVQVTAELRITDKYNDVAPGGGTNPATGNTTFEMTVPCGTTPTPDTIGSTCAITTTADAVYGDSNTVKEGTRAIWHLGEVDVYDGGADGDVETPTGNALFVTQGVFVP